MLLRRTIASAVVVAAATAPSVLLAAGPALADATSPAQQEQHRPTYTELTQSAEAARQAYDEAAAAKAAGQEKLKATFSALDQDTHPLKAAWLAAEKVANAADADKAAADQAVADAEAKLDAATDEAGKATARKAVNEAQTQVEKAAAAKADAHTKLDHAQDAWDDARVAASREYDTLDKALDKADKAKEAADKALTTAKECVRVPGLTVLANGLPSKVVAGNTVDFSFTVANNTDRTLNVSPLTSFTLLHTGMADQRVMKVQWFNGSGWQELDSRGHGTDRIATIKSMKPGARSDVKLRMAIEAQTPAKKALALLAGDASDQYNPCVLGPMKRYDFEVLPAGSKPGKVDEAKPGNAEDKDRPTPKAKPEANGSTKHDPSAKPETTPDAAKGSLATTGTSSTEQTLALAGGAAVLLGAGAVLTVRRKRGAKGTN
ncbi:LPXTG cell wall anchor domain-containing protein [Streptomyces sp. NPDC090442]|uniref:LPXTG cell wall anchor domain-containing protein n=1 Tax=Streptomyces sp. NPDC090442 TaxID=3365962 RepID=UPI003805DD69